MGSGKKRVLLGLFLKITCEGVADTKKGICMFELLVCSIQGTSVAGNHHTDPRILSRGPSESPGKEVV